MLIVNDDKIIVKKDPKGDLLCLSVLAIMTILSIVGLKLTRNIWEFIGIGIIFLFFAYGTLFSIYRTFFIKELIKVDKEGITDNSSAVSFGFIPWEDIIDIQMSIVTVRGASQQFISLVLEDEEKYLNKLSLSKRPMALANKKLTGSSIACISVAFNDFSIEEFYKQITDFREKHNL